MVKKTFFFNRKILLGDGGAGNLLSLSATARALGLEGAHFQKIDYSFFVVRNHFANVQKHTHLRARYTRLHLANNTLQTAKIS